MGNILLGKPNHKNTTHNNADSDIQQNYSNESEYDSGEETEVENNENSAPNTLVFIRGRAFPISSNHLELPNRNMPSTSSNRNQDLSEYPRLWWEYQDQFNYFYNAHFLYWYGTNNTATSLHSSSPNSPRLLQQSEPAYNPISPIAFHGNETKEASSTNANNITSTLLDVSEPGYCSNTNDSSVFEHEDNRNISTTLRLNINESDNESDIVGPDYMTIGTRNNTFTQSATNINMRNNSNNMIIPNIHVHLDSSSSEE
ncbi:hypothetical protein BB559_004763 [Furculomyces boomerangus]|uniref:Uncharacterized protein n=1 Tax=Furculomyces boomerangus TaxID=61424 RepID=A0A2T9YCV3_9FUNG|nr:hypothetical protein BB559_004763 [Furculomyces boomerangus]